jgi:gliding motility-associated-like protein
VSFILADDEVLAIRINGIPVQSLPNITTASPGSFSLPIAGLSPGLNTIEIEVRNSGLWTALEICGEIVVEQECDGILNNVEVELTEPNCSDDKMYAAYKDVFPWFVYEWDYGDGTIEIGSQPRHLFTNPGSYQVGLTITDTLCNNEYFFDFMIDVPDRTNRLFIPNAFSPNGDLLNDVFEIKGDECLVNSTFGIYDAWGQRVFYTDNPFVEFWDGTIDGAMAMDDVYVYRFESEELNKTGRVTLIK